MTLIAWGRTGLILVLSFFMSGCLAVAAGAAAGYGAVEYEDGVYTVAVPATLDATRRAAHAALDQEGATVLGQTAERTGATIRARFPDGADAELTLGPGLSGDFTRLSIRFGLFGDRARSRALAAKVRERAS